MKRKEEHFHINCECREKYKGKELKLNVDDTLEQWWSQNTDTKKCDCPFLLKGMEFSVKEGWVFSVACGVNNHLASEYLEGHFFAGRLYEEEERLVVDIFKNLIRPRDISYIETKKQTKCQHHKDSL